MWGTSGRGAGADVLEGVPFQICAVYVVGGSHRCRSPLRGTSGRGAGADVLEGYSLPIGGIRCFQRWNFAIFDRKCRCTGYTKTAFFAENQRNPRFFGRHTTGILTKCRPFVAPLSPLTLAFCRIDEADGLVLPYKRLRAGSPGRHPGARQRSVAGVRPLRGRRPPG